MFSFKSNEQKQPDNKVLLQQEILNLVCDLFEQKENECILKNQQSQSMDTNTNPNKKKYDDFDTEAFFKIITKIQENMNDFMSCLRKSSKKDVRTACDILIQAIKTLGLLQQRKKLPIKPNKYLIAQLSKILTNLQRCYEALSDFEHAGFCSSGALKQKFFQSIQNLDLTLQILYNLQNLEPVDYPLPQGTHVQEVYCAPELDKEQFEGSLDQIFQKFHEVKEVEKIVEKQVEKVVYIEKPVEKAHSGTEPWLTAIAYITGYGYVQDIAQGVKTLETDKSEKALGILGTLYTQGIYLKKDYDLALTYLERGFKANSAVCTYHLARLLEHGKQSSEVDAKYKGKSHEQKIIQLLEDASQMGSAEASCDLGFIYENGLYEKQVNLKHAQAYYERGVGLGFSKAMNNLGVLQLKQNRQQEGLEMIRQACIKLDQQGQINQAISLLEGWGQKHAPELGIEMFNSCRNFHLTTGNNHVAHYYLFNTEKPENHRKAFELVMAKLIWHHDDSESHYLLGHMYHFGLGVPKDYNEAIKYYIQAANENHSDALNQCGDFYYSGFGELNQDMDLAVEYYEKAAKLNNVQALLNLGIIYEDSNKSKALQYFQRAKELGNTDGLYNSAVMMRDLNLNLSQANQDILTAMNKGNKEASQYFQLHLQGHEHIQQVESIQILTQVSQ